MEIVIVITFIFIGMMLIEYILKLLSDAIGVSPKTIEKPMKTPSSLQGVKINEPVSNYKDFLFPSGEEFNSYGKTYILYKCGPIWAHEAQFLRYVLVWTLEGKILAIIHKDNKRDDDFFQFSNKKKYKKALNQYFELLGYRHYELRENKWYRWKSKDRTFDFIRRNNDDITRVLSSNWTDHILYSKIIDFVKPTID